MNVKFQKYKKRFLVLLLLVMITSFPGVFAQETIRIMSYNLNDYATDNTRDTDFISVISTITPDIFVAIELTSSTSASNFRNNVLNMSGNGTYTMGTFVSNPNNSSDNSVIYYKSSKFSHVSSSIVISSGNHPVYRFVLQYATGLQLIIFGVHFTSATASNPEQKRYDEATAIRTITNQYQNGEYFIAVGDFNLSNANEVVPNQSYGAFKTLVGSPSNGKFFDPQGFDGSTSWSSSTYSYLRTFTIKASSSSFISRFDLILNSQTVLTPGGIEYKTGTFTVAGNLSGSFTNISSSYKSASDHLPVYADYYFPSIPTPVELASFNVDLYDNRIELQWRTETEVNNYGFNIERSLSSQETNWETIGFVEGNGNSNSPKFYNYSDYNIDKSGTVSYRLKQIDNDGSFEYSPIVNIQVDAPINFYLGQNYPNPFNPSTKIKYTIPDARTSSINFVQLKVFDILGKEVATLVNEEKTSGTYEVEFSVDGNIINLPSGIYIYRLTSGNYTITKKMILEK